MAKVLITMEGGVIHSVISDTEDIEVLIKDLDTEGACEDEIMVLDGEECFRRSPYPTHVNKEAVQLNFNQANQQSKL